MKIIGIVESSKAKKSTHCDGSIDMELVKSIKECVVKPFAYICHYRLCKPSWLYQYEMLEINIHSLTIGLFHHSHSSLKYLKEYPTTDYMNSSQKMMCYMKSNSF